MLGLILRAKMSYDNATSKGFIGGFMIESQKSYRSIQYKMQFWIFLEKMNQVTQYLSMKRTREDHFKKVLICLENDDMEKAVTYLQRAKKRMLTGPEMAQLEALIYPEVSRLN